MRGEAICEARLHVRRDYLWQASEGVTRGYHARISREGVSRECITREEARTTQQDARLGTEKACVWLGPGCRPSLLQLRIPLTRRSC